MSQEYIHKNILLFFGAGVLGSALPWTPTLDRPLPKKLFIEIATRFADKQRNYDGNLLREIVARALLSSV